MRLQLAACHCCLHCKSGVLEFCFLSHKYAKVLAMFKTTIVTLVSRSCPNYQQLFCTRIRRMSGRSITLPATIVTENTLLLQRIKESKLTPWWWTAGTVANLAAREIWAVRKSKTLNTHLAKETKMAYQFSSGFLRLHTHYHIQQKGCFTQKKPNKLS